MSCQLTEKYSFSPHYQIVRKMLLNLKIKKACLATNAERRVQVGYSFAEKQLNEIEVRSMGKCQLVIIKYKLTVQVAYDPKKKRVS